MESLLDKTILGDAFAVLPLLPSSYVDLVIVDPPYNLSKDFGASKFSRMSNDAYMDWLDGWLVEIRRILKPTGTLYVCSEWSASYAVQLTLEKHFEVRNRITWEREKGRGAKTNWKNCSEDIWFCTVSNEYTFNVESVRLKRRVIAPYTDDTGNPKDWEESQQGRFRLTAPSNLWTDISVPFWSMPENTDHPTQKAEKLVAKLVLASSNPGDLVLDPFLGSGTTSVVASKLNRHYLGIEIDAEYACLAEKRLEIAAENQLIQGYEGGAFWERNTLAYRKQNSSKSAKRAKKTKLTQGELNIG